MPRPILMSGHRPPCLERLLDLKNTPDLRMNAYIRANAKDFGRTDGSLYYHRKYPIPAARIYLYMSHIRSRME